MKPSSSQPKPPNLTCLTIIIITIYLTCTTPIVLSDPRISEAGLFCGTNRTASPNFIPLFTSSMDVLSQRVTLNLSGTSNVSSPNNTIYNLAQCHSDLTRDDCLQCYAASRTRIPRCVPSVAGRIYLDGCFIRYDYYSFYNESVSQEMDTINCNATIASSNEENRAEFGRNVGELVDRLVEEESGRGNGYAVRGNRGVFGLAQCWNTVSRDGCRVCLEKAGREVRRCLPSREGRALNTGCFLRYSTERFYSNNTRDGSEGSGSSRTRALAIALSVVAFCMLCLFAGYAAYKRWKKRQLARSNLGLISYSYNKSKLNFKYETLEKATNYFDDTRKLGQGGAGSVYKGNLPNGKIVAVKRLFFSTRQWVDEFFNEINLISGIEHKNLVKLLGCSIEGPESLLVYEYVANRSLEQHIFDKNMDKPLQWKERYHVIVGTAEGLAYLHGGTELRIIHRDIKSSNVLLDEKLNAKIADFGLARLFAPDKTHLSTGIAGTLGYMAPEYLVKGQLTEKADVFSFGVLVLEVVCGRKNNAFADDSGSLLQTVWKLYKTERVTESVDPNLNGEFPAMEATKVLKIGLLCAQASVANRPSMVDVVQMLTDENCEIPEPNQPPFLNTGGHSASTTRSSYSINSSTSNVITKHEASDPSSESFSIQNSDGIINRS